ncbi:MAG TPA: hypothetical protein VFM28_01215 [Nitrososphaeraceae archaeon]|nr:hypothetical protein [Nitrososphaeraceae archaeon]
MIFLAMLLTLLEYSDYIEYKYSMKEVIYPSSSSSNRLEDGLLL